jgi:hypothetical protein
MLTERAGSQKKNLQGHEECRQQEAQIKRNRPHPETPLSRCQDIQTEEDYADGKYTAEKQWNRIAEAAWSHACQSESRYANEKRR